MSRPPRLLKCNEFVAAPGTLSALLTGDADENARQGQALGKTGKDWRAPRQTQGRDSVRHEVKREGRTARAGRGSTRSARAKTDDILAEHALREQQFRTMVKRAGTMAPAGARLIDFRPAQARVRAHAKTLVGMARQCHSRNGKVTS